MAKDPAVSADEVRARHDTSPTGGGPMLEEGDAAQASERHDMRLASRERIVRRINQLTMALERLADGDYGRCEVCGGDIEPQRLAALPEAASTRRGTTRRRLSTQGSPATAALRAKVVRS